MCVHLRGAHTAHMHDKRDEMFKTCSYSTQSGCRLPSRFTSARDAHSPVRSGAHTHAHGMLSDQWSGACSKHARRAVAAALYSRRQTDEGCFMLTGESGIGSAVKGRAPLDAGASVYLVTVSPVATAIASHPSATAPAGGRKQIAVTGVCVAMLATRSQRRSSGLCAHTTTPDVCPTAKNARVSCSASALLCA